MMRIRSNIKKKLTIGLFALGCTACYSGGSTAGAPGTDGEGDPDGVETDAGSESGAEPEPEPPRPPAPEPPGDDDPDPNDLDPEKLFDCQPDETTYTPRRVWRKSGPQFVRMAADLAGSSQVDAPNPFGGAQSGKTFTNYAESFAILEPELNTVLRSGRKAAVWSLRDRAPGCVKSMVSDYDDGIEPSDPLEAGWFDEECRESTVRWAYAELIGRPPSNEEVVHHSDAMAEITASLGLYRGLTASITMMFGHPEALFRSELGEQGADGLYALDAYELANAISLTLAGRSSNDSNLTAFADDGRILDPDGLAEVIELLFADTSRHTYRATMRGMLNEYFHYSDGAGVLKPHKQGYSFGASLRELEDFVDYRIVQDADFVNQLLTSTDVVVLEDDEFQVTEDLQRPGMLSRAAWLASFSETEENDPIHRGYFIRTQLLCQSVPDIPIGVIPQLPDATEETTLRERLAEHSENPGCETCHALMDPLGLPFEQYDHYGGWRETEAGRAVETHGEIVLSPSFDQVVETPLELVQALGSSTEVEQCFVRHLFRYSMGRDETYGDACTLAAAHETYVESGGSLKATMASLVSSETFRYRTEEE